MRVLCVTPPLTQLNTPYPATAFLTGFLKSRGINVVQDDLSIRLIHKLFCRDGLKQIDSILKENDTQARSISPHVRFFLDNLENYLKTIEPTVSFLQGIDPSLATRIAKRSFLPEGPCFQKLSENQLKGEYLEWAFGNLGITDQAKFFASLYIDDLAFVIQDGIDSNFNLSKYGEKLAASAATFDVLEERLRTALMTPTLIDDLLEKLTMECIEKHKPDLVCITLPFPGNVYGGLKIAQSIKSHFSSIKIACGGGYANTELRDLKDPRIFEYIDFICLDDGEKPLMCLIEYLENRRSKENLVRTYFCEVRGDNVQDEKKQVQFINDTKEKDFTSNQKAAPNYEGLPLDQYLSLVEMLNPMHRLWSDARWNKIMIAHGCYWKKCNFCDVSLDYISRYEPSQADIIIDQMIAIKDQTKQSGFHFVDEAAPPAGLRSLSTRLLERGLQFSWWGNIRFEKTFDSDLTRLMSKAGCIAVTGGLEVASDRLLKLMNKGVSIEQVARVTKAFQDAGILVHAYLMYGFPTQSVQETIDSLEIVRQLFHNGCLDSAYWHRFSATIHSPIGREPEKFGIKIINQNKSEFANNDLIFEDPTGCDHDKLGFGLRKAIYNFMHGVGLEEDVRFWFDFPVPKTTVPENRIEGCVGYKRS